MPDARSVCPSTWTWQYSGASCRPQNSQRAARPTVPVPRLPFETKHCSHRCPTCRSVWQNLQPSPRHTASRVRARSAVARGRADHALRRWCPGRPARQQIGRSTDMRRATRIHTKKLTKFAGRAYGVPCAYRRASVGRSAEDARGKPVPLASASAETAGLQQASANSTTDVISAGSARTSGRAGCTQARGPARRTQTSTLTCANGHSQQGRT